MIVGFVSVLFLCCLYVWFVLFVLFMCFLSVFFFQAEDGIRYAQESRGLGDVYKRQASTG